MLFPKYGSNTKENSNIFQLDSLFREEFVQLIILKKKREKSDAPTVTWWEWGDEVQLLNLSAQDCLQVTTIIRKILKRNKKLLQIEIIVTSFAVW